MRCVLNSVGWICFLSNTLCFAQERAHLEFPYQPGEVLTIEADRLIHEEETRWVAEGSVVLRYRDAIVRTSRLIYNPVTDEAVLQGDVEIRQGTQWLKGTRGELNLETGTGTLYDVDGFADDQFYLKVKKLEKTGDKTYVAHSGFMTACEEARPKWSFTVSKTQINLDSTARLKHTLFRVKNVPVFYFPYIILPTEKKDRSSGFLLPSIGNSNKKGRSFSQSFYLVLGRSADATVRADYFSQRGFGYGFNFRTQPNEATRFYLDSYGVDDRKGQGGVAFNGVGETRFANGFRGVARFNLVSNFVFRQVFSENFYTATRPNEISRLFLTNNFQARSFNFLLSREETRFTGPNVVIRHTPAFRFKLMGQQLFQTPLYLDLDTSAEGLSRRDRLIETAGITQRLDLFPRLYFSVPLFQGLRLSPNLSFRETFYSDSFASGGMELSGSSLHRRYFQLGFDLKGWGLSRIYRPDSRPHWKHLVEPVVSYRYLTGIEDFDRLIRFDEREAVANTHEVEYGLWNRIFVKRGAGDKSSSYEWLSFKLAQKHFFDPDFGGALEPNRINQFYPLNTLTGLPYAGVKRNSSPVTGLIRFSPHSRFNFDVRGDFDTKFRRFRNFSVTGFYRREQLSAGATYFVMEQLEPGTFQSQLLQARVTLGNLRRGLSGSVRFSYDAERARFLNTRSRVSYVWDCCGVSLEFQRYNLGVLRQEKQLRFSFFLKGIGAFGTMNRPSAVFPGTNF